MRMLLSREDLPLRWENASPKDSDIALVFYDELTLLFDDDVASFPTRARILKALPDVTLYPAFTQGDRNFWVAYAQTTPEAASLRWQSVRAFREMADHDAAIALITGYHFAKWLSGHCFCGCCGQQMQPSPTERALVCPACKQIVYPVISPAVTVAITDGDRILLAQNAYGVFKQYSLIAGYAEIGESLEQTVSREVMEEVGLRVRNVRYVASQPWGLSQTLMIGFHAELEGPDKLLLQRSELSDARWFNRSELEARDHPASLSFEMIERFRRGTL